MAILVDPKLEGFNIIQATYKTVGDHDIRTDILVPKTPSSGKRPVIIRFHGGGLVSITNTSSLNFATLTYSFLTGDG